MLNNKIMLIGISIILLLAMILIAGKINLSNQFQKQVKSLFADSKTISNKIFQKELIQDLPEPVQRYFNFALKEGQPYISYARITHEGKFKTGFDKDWVNIKGEQYAITSKPGYIWKGTTNMFVARDMYIGDKGRLVVSLFSLFNIVDATGEQYDQGELIRWLGESVFYPTNLLPSKNLKWFPIDSNSAKLTYNYNELNLFLIITFNSIGEITQMETSRYMDKDQLETWVIKMKDYNEFNNVIIPTNFEVLWRLKKGDFSYAKFNLIKIEYDNPQLL